MKKISLIIIITIISISFISASPYSSSTTNNNPYSSNTNKVEALKYLSDTNIDNPLEMQTLLYNSSSTLWYNAYLNDSSHSVNNSILWDGNLYGDEGHWGINGNDIFYNAGNVGIGTSTPQNKLNIIGDMNATNAILTGQLNITTDVTGGGPSQINIHNTDPFGFAGIRFENDIGDESFQGIFSRALSNILVPDLVNVNQSISGYSSRGGPIITASTENNSIYFGSSPTQSLFTVDWFIELEPIEQAIILQGNKKIRPIKVDGGFSLVLESEEVLDSGGVPFTFIARTSDNKTIITSWQQNGANNSFSGRMNSGGPVPKNWILANNNQSTITDLEFMFNVSNYIKYCDWLQSNLSLVPEGCKFFADTTGRGVPLSFAGDFEVHQDSVLHGGLLIYDDFDYIDRDDTDFNLIWTKDNSLGSLHIRADKTIEANLSVFNVSINDFEGGQLAPLVSESIAPEVGRDWDNIDDYASCHDNLCSRALGGNEKVMSFTGDTTFSGGTVAATKNNISFWYTSVYGIGDSLEVEIDDNLGNVSTLFLDSASVVDNFVNVQFPAFYENKSNITTRFIFIGQNVQRETYIDDIRIFSIPESPIIINETYRGGRTDFGDDGCYIEVDRFVNNLTQSTGPIMNLVCPNINIVGNVTAVSVTEVSINVTDDVSIGGDLIVDGLIYGNGSQLTDLAAGTNGQVQFNNGGNLGADSNFTWDNVNKRLGVGTTSPVTALHLNTGIGSLSTGLSFGDGDTGFAESTDDVLRVYLKGDNDWTFSTGGFFGSVSTRPGLRNAAASATLPTIMPSYTADSDTGIGRAGDDQLSLIAGGVNGLNVVEIGGVANVGIGTTQPSYKLHVSSPTHGSVMAEGRNAGGTTGNAFYGGMINGTIYSFFGTAGGTDGFITGSVLGDLAIRTENKNIIFGTASSSSAHMFIKKTTGEVGIGTTSPQNKLDVSGAQVIGSTYAGVNTAPTDGLLVEGNLGIGTTNPSVELEVIGDVLISGLAGTYTGGSAYVCVYNNGTLFSSESACP